MSRKMRPGCAYFARCKEFFDSMTLAADLFDPEWDMCYCTDCHKWRGDSEIYARGNPPKNYRLPIGWARFALKLSAEAKAIKANENWHRAFHGTPVECIQPILEMSRLVAEGHNLETGTLDICHDEEEREDWHIYWSPSINYAGYYSDPEFIRLSDRRRYQTRVAFYTLIEPNSYKVKEGKIRDPKQNDSQFHLSEIDWFSDEEGEHVLYGLMVHMEKC